MVLIIGTPQKGTPNFGKHPFVRVARSGLVQSCHLSVVAWCIVQDISDKGHGYTKVGRMRTMVFQDSVCEYGIGYLK